MKEKDLELAKEEYRETLNRSEITAYPLFDTCKETEVADLETQKKCFLEQTSVHIYKYLEKQSLKTDEMIQDTIYLDIEVSKEGKFKLVTISGEENLSEELINLKVLCNEAIETIPELEKPATKNTITASIVFKMPLILKSNSELSE